MSAEDNDEDILKGVSNVVEESTDTEQEKCDVKESEDNRENNNKSRKQSNHGANGNTEKTCYIHKYSKGIPLAEAVIVTGKPYFIQMKEGLDFDLLDELTIDNIVLKLKDIHPIYANLTFLNLRKK